MGTLIKAEALSLDVPIYLQPDRDARSWGAMFFGAVFDPPRRHHVRLLDDIGFELRDGDRLAILGRNGAGKSTLLRVLNRVYQPTSGSLAIQGSCQALLNMSLGFNSEATVRENIFLRGIAMGLKASYLRHQIAPILEFSGLQDKVTHRLRTLSAGQKMRLGFAISTCVQNDIILMDEWVGAGDADFMTKAKERMQDRVGGSKILVLASHSVGLLRNVCNRGIVLEGGRLVHAGDITSALKAYHDVMEEMRARREAAAQAGRPSGAQVYGAVETIRPGGEPGQVIVKGWMVDTEGALPEGIVLEAGGRRYPATTVARLNRPDVAKHFGLSNASCGFEAEFAVPGMRQVADLGTGIRILGGASAEQADAPLRLGDAAKAALAARA